MSLTSVHSQWQWRIAGCARDSSSQNVLEEVAHSYCLQQELVHQKSYIYWTCLFTSVEIQSIPPAWLPAPHPALLHPPTVIKLDTVFLIIGCQKCVFGDNIIISICILTLAMCQVVPFCTLLQSSFQVGLIKLSSTFLLPPATFGSSKVWHLLNGVTYQCSLAVTMEDCRMCKG